MENIEMKLSRKKIGNTVGNRGRKQIRSKTSRKNMKYKIVSLLLVCSMIGTSISGGGIATLKAQEANYLSEELLELMTWWVSLDSEAQSIEWDNLSVEEQELIWAQADEDGNIDASLYLPQDTYIEESGTAIAATYSQEEVSKASIETYGSLDTHAGSPSWCTCVLDTGIRHMVLNEGLNDTWSDNGYTQDFKKILSPSGAPKDTYQKGSTTLKAGNGITPTWTRAEGQFLNYGFYNGAAVTYRILDIEHTQGYVLDGVPTQKVDYTSVYVLSKDPLYTRAWSGGTSNWTSSTARTNVNTTGFLTKDGVFTDRESADINETTVLAISTYNITDEGYTYSSYSDLEATDKIFFTSAREDDGYYLNNLNRIGDTTSITTRSFGRSKGSSTQVSAWSNLGQVGWPGFITYATTTNTMGITPAFNLDYQSIAFTTNASIPKSTFGKTSIVGYTGDEATAIASRTWDVTMDGGTGFDASWDEESPIGVGQTTTIDINTLGTYDHADTKYTQISAALVDKYGTVQGYGKIGDIPEGSDSFKVNLTMPTYSFKEGTYDLYVFAEEVNSSTASGSMTHMTDYASNFAYIAEVYIEAGYDFTLTPGSGMTLVDGDENKYEQIYMEPDQSIGTFVFEANEGYYFPDSYGPLGTCNGITVSKISDTQIQVTGNIEDHTKVVLTAPSLINYTVTFGKLLGSTWDIVQENSYTRGDYVGNITIPTTTSTNGEMFKYWQRYNGSADQLEEEDRLYAGDYYSDGNGQLPLEDRTYEAVFGPYTSVVEVAVYIDMEAPGNYYSQSLHGQTISLYKGSIKEYEDCGESMTENGTRIRIIDVENGTYDVYFGDVKTGTQITINATEDRGVYEAKLFYYTVTFDYNNKGVTSNLTTQVFQNQWLQSAQVPTKAEIDAINDNELFLHWSESGSTDKVVPESQAITSTTKFVAQYEKSSHQVTFLDQNGDVYKELDGMYQLGTSIAAPEGPVVSGKLFAYWIDNTETIRLYPDSDTQNMYTVLDRDYATIFTPVYDISTSDLQLELHLDDEDWIGHGKTFTLVQNGEVVSSMTSEDSFISLLDGTYEIYMNGKSIGESVTIKAPTLTGHTTTVELDFYTVTYYLNNGDTPDKVTQEVLKGQEAVDPSVDPVKEGYAFDYWSGSRDTIQGKGREFQAIYTPNQYVVRFQEEDGSLISEDEYDCGSTVNAPAYTVKEGYELNYWLATDGSGTKLTYAPYAYVVQAKDITFEPVYKEVSSNVTFDVWLDGNVWSDHDKTFLLQNTTTNSIYYMSGSLSNTFLNIPVGTYKFLEKEESGGTIDLNRTVEVTGLEVNVSLVMPLQYFTVRYLDDINGEPFGEDESVHTQIIYQYKNTVVPTATPSKEGYTFKEWSHNGKGIDSTLDIYPLYSKGSYQMVFKDYDNSLIQANFQEEGELLDVPSPNPTREHYIFTGWSPTTPTYVPGENMVFTATYMVDPDNPPDVDEDKDLYNVRFQDKDGNVVDDANYNVPGGTLIEVPQGPDDGENSFSYWQEVVDGVPVAAGIVLDIKGNPGLTYAAPERDIVFEPVYGQNTGTVILDIYLDDQEWMAEGKVFTLYKDGVYYDLFDATNKCSGVVNGDYLIYMNNQSTGKSVTVASNQSSGYEVTVTLEFYTVEYDYDNGGNPETVVQQVLKGQYGTPPSGTGIVKEGYTFAGWPQQETILEPTIYVANYSPTKYSVIFKDTLVDGTVLEDFGGPVFYDTVVQAPAAPVVEGKELYYWQGDDGITKLSVSPYNYQVSNKDIIFTPVYRDATGSASLNIYLDYVRWTDCDKEFVIQNTSTGTLYTANEYGIFSSVPTGDYKVLEKTNSGNLDTKLTITVDGLSALPNSVDMYYFTVRYLDAQGGTPVVEDQIILKGNSAIVPSEVPEKAGYTFKGWSRDNLNIQNTEDIYPLYEGGKFLITFKDWDGTVLQIGFQEEGTALEVPANPSRDGYTFTGWSPVVTTTVPGADTVYVAQYTKDVVEEDDTQVPEEETVEPEEEPEEETTPPSTTPPTTIPPTTTTTPSTTPSVSPSTTPSTTTPSTSDEVEDEDDEEPTMEETLEVEKLPDTYPSIRLPGDITTGGDANGNGIPDYLEDLDGDGVIDGLIDNNGNGIPDYLEDLNGNGIPDGYEDMNGNGIPDYLEDDFVNAYVNRNNCKNCFMNLFIMILILVLEWMWLIDRKRQQNRRLRQIKRSYN